ncbi:MAG TPA: histidine kinase [Solirubrobacteraceae bacterium]
MRQRLPDAFRRPATAGERLPSWVDGVIALALLALSLAHSRNAGLVAIVLNVALVAPLLWRRRAPVPVFALIWLVAAVQSLAVGPAFADSALLVAFYTIAVTSGLRTTAGAGAALELGIVLAVSQVASGAEPWLKAVIGLSGLATAAGVLGINVRNRRLTLAGLRQRADRLQHEHEHEVQLATAGERARIAREMHDVVAHNLTVMVALCDGAAYQADESPDRVKAALDQASKTGRQALAEMRQLLGVLREPPMTPDLAPQPGIRQIGELVDQIRAAGVPATYTLSGACRRAPAGLELAIYRIAQEALTNTLKHAGSGASVAVSLTCADDAIEVEVSDTGNMPHRPSGDGAGLRGMRERAAVYDGTLEAGPSRLGGWRVRAALKLPAGRLAAVR